LEQGIKSIAGENGMDLKIFGKSTEHFPRYGEFTPDIVEQGFVKILKKNFPEIKIDANKISELEIKSLVLPSRPPVLCPGCPHRATAYAAKQAAEKDAIFPMDIGCYTLVLQKPLQTADIVLCMGSSVGTACGFSKATEQQIIAFIGDSTFFHAGIPGLINAVHSGHKFVLTILDNRTTAMTGFQPHPGVDMGSCGKKAKAIDISEVVKGCGAEFVEVADPYDLKKTQEIFKKALKHPSISVIVARHPCALVEIREKKRKGEKIILYDVDHEICIKCCTCTSKFGCPASYVGEDEFPRINSHLCIGCGVCAQACPSGAIRQQDKSKEGEANG
jgi:indolepyruvate ferredoxin oxidoreductase alpha subunit